MLGQAQQAFIEAEVAYRRERLMAGMHPTTRSHRPGRVKWVQGLIDALTGNSRDPRRGAIQHDGDGQVIRPASAPHHATSH